MAGAGNALLRREIRLKTSRRPGKKTKTPPSGSLRLIIDRFFRLIDDQSLSTFWIQQKNRKNVFKNP
uniref:Uncharacterized protein n=1 Tax=Romanomermis culicivorax TaxID=13658 RepID=A0A915KU66_ROMCU